MSRRRDATKLLRWYPAAWRDRYGAEFLATVEDDLDGRRATTTYRARIALAGLHERLVESALVGGGAPTSRRRSGALLVLGAWSALVVAGASFAKLAEHFATHVPVPARTAPVAAYDAVAAAGVLGVLLILVGVAVALPGFLSFLRAGGWSRIRRSAHVAVVLSGFVVVATVVLSRWAHHLGAAQRNGADDAYSVAFVTLAVAGVATLGAWTVLAARSASLSITERALRIEARLATALAGVAAAVLSASAWWWQLMVERAPSFFGGVAPGRSASALTPQVVATLAVMALALVTCAYGVWRISSAGRDPARG